MPISLEDVVLTVFYLDGLGNTLKKETIMIYFRTVFYEEMRRK